MVEPTSTPVTVTVDIEVYRRVEAAQDAYRAAGYQWQDALKAKGEPARLAEAIRELAEARRDLVAAYTDLARELVNAEALLLPLLHHRNLLEDDAVHADEYAETLDRREVSSGEERG